MVEFFKSLRNHCVLIVLLAIVVQYTCRKFQGYTPDPFRYSGTFRNRSQQCEAVCIVLAGYKPYLYKAVFNRLKKFCPKWIDVCVVSAGLYSEELNSLCEVNGWSYLSMIENNVCLAQNVAIKLHPAANMIFKMDEDIFLTEHYFTKMYNAYRHAQTTKYYPGVIAPLLTLNGYSTCRILDLFKSIHIFERLFEPLKCGTGPEMAVESNAAVAKFLWGDGSFLPTIDEMNHQLGEHQLEERPCPIRFSIGAIMFERTLWERMGFFQVRSNGPDLGADEEQLNTFCCLNSRPIMVSENIVVGHFSFRLQREKMQEYFLAHPELNELP